MPELKISDRLKHAWNAFKFEEKKEETFSYLQPGVVSSSIRQDHIRIRSGKERSIVTSVYTRIAIDVSAIAIKHVKLDQNEVFSEIVQSGLNRCLSLEANIDQTGREFIFDAVMSMFDEGVVALVPVDTTYDITKTDSYQINTMRTGRITSWYPKHIRVEVYNENNGKREEVTLPKSDVAIIENPFYAVMNEPNSTLKRLVRKLAILDAVDEQSGASKLDMIIQLPYVIRSEKRQEQAEQRRKQIEEQLMDSKYGIAYTDATEKIVQLNRSVENNLMGQIEYLTKTLYSQLGITQEVFDGNADEKTMLNYYNRSVEPILTAFCDNMKRSFLSKTAQSQGQSIEFFRDPFKLVPVSELAEIADKFTRNEILSSNELRGIIGYRPVDDERADELRNKNINSPYSEEEGAPRTDDTDQDVSEEYNGPIESMPVSELI